MENKYSKIELIGPAATKQRVRFYKLAIVRTEDKEFTWEYLEVEIQSACIYSGRW